MATGKENDDAATPKFAIIAGICAVLLAGMIAGASLWVLAAIAAGILVAANALLTRSWASLSERWSISRLSSWFRSAPTSVTKRRTAL